MKRLGLALVAGVLVAACAAHTTDPSLDAAAKTFRAAAGQACVYVVPTSSTYEVTVRLDGRKVGTLGTENFLRLDVPPGRHTLSAAPDSLLPTVTGAPPENLTVEAEAGQCYFLRTVWTDFDRSWRQPRVYLERIKEDEGQQAVNVRTLTLPMN